MIRKVVRTQLESDEYSALAATAKKNRLTIREALRQAALKWVEENSGINPDDPIFRMRAVDWGKGTENASKQVDKTQQRTLGRVGDTKKMRKAAERTDEMRRRIGRIEGWSSTEVIREWRERRRPS